MEDLPYSCNADDTHELHPGHSLAKLDHDTAAHAEDVKDVDTIGLIPRPFGKQI